MRTHLFKRAIPTIFAALAFTSAPSMASAATPSFDCARAATAVEHLICGSSQLAQKDRDVAEAYREAKRVLSAPEWKELQAAQRKWAKTRAAACPSIGNAQQKQQATACLAGLYDSRRNTILNATARAMLLQPGTDIQADRRAPVVCVRFDAKLAKKQPAALESYVSSRNGAKLAARISDNQLCIEGMPHGVKDQLTIHAGLRSANAVLRDDETLDVDVPNRPRRAAFPSSGLILPMTGSAGLPIETVNLDKVRVLVLRVDDSDVVANLRRGLIGQQVGYDEVGRVASKLGQNVWTGELLVDSKPNQSVRTALPVGDVLPNLQSGVYLAVAEDPTSDFHEGYWATAQWFVVSDIGLTAFRGQDGLTVAVRSLETALPKPGAKLVLQSENGDILTTVQTGDDGMARFQPGYLRGKGKAAPHTLLAYGSSGDFVYLNLKRAALDLSDRGVDGRTSPTELDAYLTTERGVYRPGEPVHFSALLRTANSDAIKGQPMTLRVHRQDGLEVYRKTLADKGLGGYATTITLPPTAATGNWRASLHASAKGNAIGSTRFLVEDFVPPRIEASVTAKRQGNYVQAATQADFLYGAPAANIPVEVVATVREAKTPVAAFKGYSFGLAQEEKVTARRLGQALGETDDAGASVIEVALDDLPTTTRPLEAEIKASVFDVGGRPLIARTILPLKNLPQLIGIKPLFEDGGIREGATASFNVVALDGSGAAEAKRLDYAIVREDHEYVWFNQGGRWDYRVLYFDAGLVHSGTLDVAADRPALVSHRFDGWGRFRLDVTDTATGAASSIRFHAGWWGAGAGADPAPDKVKIAIGPGPFSPGDLVRATVEPPFDAEVMATVVDSAMQSVETATIPATGGEITFRLPKDGAAGVYLLVNAYGKADGERTQAPRRAIGAHWIAYDQNPSKVAVALTVPETTEPERTVDVAVQLGAELAGTPAFVTVAAVDDGVLGLTGYKAPNPSQHFLGKRKLGVKLQDVYGQFIDAAGSAIGRVRSGGDADLEVESNQLSNLPKKTQPVLAMFSGIIEVDPNGKAVVPLNLPDFTGRVRIMAQAWSQDRVGQAEKTMLVRRPMVATLAMPRFLSPDDTAFVSVSLRNLSGPAGLYRAEVTTSGVLGAPENAILTATLNPGDPDARAQFEMLAIAPGDSEVVLTVTGPNGLRFERRRVISTRPANAVVTRKSLVSLKPGAKLTVDRTMIDGLYAETASVTLGVNPLPDFDLPSILAGLARYPYGCAEQTTSKALPMLYVGTLKSALRIKGPRQAADGIAKGVSRLAGMQASSGGFGYWNSQSEAGVWVTAYVTDYLVEARKAGHAVPEGAINRALTRLSGLADIRSRYNRRYGSSGAAYALYVRAKAGVADPARIRRFAARLPGLKPTPLTQAFVAASLAAVGDQDRARALFAAINHSAASKSDVYYFNYGSKVRDLAAIVALAAESRATNFATLEAQAATLSGMIRERRWLSTQEKAWIVRAAAKLSEASSRDTQILVDGDALTLSGGEGLYRTVAANDIDPVPHIQNNSDRIIRGSVTVLGAPNTVQPSADRGFNIRRGIFSADGKALNPLKLSQSDLVVVVLQGKMTAKGRARALIVDYLPAGFELENARLGGDNLGAYGWLGALTTPEHTELRDDRYVAQVNTRNNRDFRVAYIARAVTPGRFAHAGAFVEDMYRPEQFGRSAANFVAIMAR